MKDMTEREKLLEIIKKAIDISESTNADVFADYSPHVQTVSIRVYMNGWKENAGTDICVVGKYGNELDSFKLETEPNENGNYLYLDSIIDILSVIEKELT